MCATYDGAKGEELEPYFVCALRPLVSVYLCCANAAAERQLDPNFKRVKVVGHHWLDTKGRQSYTYTYTSRLYFFSLPTNERSLRINGFVFVPWVPSGKRYPILRTPELRRRCSHCCGAAGHAIPFAGLQGAELHGLAGQLNARVVEAPVMVAKEDGGAVDLNIGAIPINREALVPALEGKDDECANSPTPELLDLLRIRVAGKGWIEFNPHGQAEFIWVCYNASPCHASRPLATARFCKVGLPPRCPEAQKVQDRWPEVRDPSWRHSYRDDSQVCPHDACRHCVSLIF